MSPFWPFAALFGPLLAPLDPSWPLMSPYFTTLRRARRPKWAPECPEEAHVGPFWSILVTFETHLGPFWPLCHVLGGHFFITCPHILEEPFCTICLVFHRCTALHYLFCFSQMCSSAPSALRGPGLPLQVPRSAFASLKATKSLDISYVFVVNEVNNGTPAVKMDEKGSGRRAAARRKVVGRY